MNNMIKRITFLIFGLTCLLGHGQAATGSASATALSDSRDYTLTVDSGGRGNPNPAEGTHTYAWHAAVVATVDATVTEGDILHSSTGWTGTAAVPVTGSGNTTGEITLTELSSTITWQWDDGSLVNLIDIEHGFGAGSFELGQLQESDSNDQTLWERIISPSLDKIGGWSVVGGSIDWQEEKPSFDRFIGARSIDLAGNFNSSGAIETEIPTELGRSYVVRFSAYDNSNTDEVILKANGIEFGRFAELDKISASDYKEYSAVFVATASTTVLNIGTAATDGFGPVVDDVIVHLSDSDDDGLADFWEFEYFGNLDRTGLGDFDRDGRTDAQEFNDDTDPMDAGSALGLLVYYPFNSDLTEATGSFASASITGTHSFVDSANGEALYLNRHANGTLPTIDFSVFDELTLSLWVREIQQFGPTDTGGHYHGTSYVQWGDQETENSLRISHIQGNISVWPGVGATYDPGWESVWKHYTATYSTDGVRLYVDGQLVSELPVAGFVSDLNASGMIGAHRANNAHYYDRIEAEFDELRVYGRALNSNEIETLYNGTAPKTYSVTFDLGAYGTRSGGGELSQSIQEGGAAAAPTVDANTGWEFVGWDISFDSITEDTTVTAQYETAGPYTVTFDLVGKGTRTGGGELIQSVIKNEAAVPPTFTPDQGLLFTRWDTDFSNVTSNLTIAAIYVSSPSGSTGIIDFTDRFFPSELVGASITYNVYESLESLTRTGKLNYWGNYSDLVDVAWGGSFGEAQLTGEVRLTAPEGYLVHLDSFEMGAIRSQGLDVVVYDGAFNVLADYSGDTIDTSQHNDYQPGVSARDIRLRWTDPWDVAIDNITFSVQPEGANLFTVTFDLGDHGTLTGGGTLTQQVEENSAVELPIFEVEDNWVFTGWDTAESAYNNVTENLTVTALYKQVFSLTVNSLGSGSVSVSPNLVSFDVGASVTLTATADSGHRFTGWSGDDSGSTNPLSVTMISNRSITANFEVIPNLPPTANAGPDLSATDNSGDGSATVTFDGSASTDSDGSIDSYAWTWDDNGPKTASGVSPQASFPVGTTMVTLTITDDDGASDTDTVLVTIDAYVPPTYTLSLDTSGNGSITANPVQSTFVEGATVTLTATPDSGYQFTGWSGDASGATNPLSVTMDQNRSITAHFELIVTQDISFDLDLHGTRTGGGELAQTVVEGDRPEAPIFTVASGFFFDGWTVLSDEVAGTVTYTAEYLPLAPVEGDFAEVFDFEDGREAYAEAFTIVGSNGHLADGGLGGSAGVRQVGSIYDSVTRNRPFALRENTVVTLELAFKTPSNRLSSSGGDMLNLGLASDPSTNWRAETGEQVYFDLDVSNTGSAIRLGQIRFPSRNGAVFRTAQGDVLQAELAFEEWYLLRFVLQLSDTNPMVGLEIASIGPDGTRAPERVTSIPLSSLAVALGSSGPYYVDTIASLLSDSTVYPVFNGGTPGQSSGAGGIDNFRIFIDHADAPDPNMLPIADAGIDFSRLDNDGDGFASLILDGSASVDLDGFISTAEWSWLDENEITQRVVGLAAMAALPVGTTDVSLTVTDNNGATATDTTKVTVFAPGDPDAFAGYLFKGGFNQMTRGRLDDLSDWVNLLGPDHVPSFGFVQDIEIAPSIGKIFFASNVDNLLTVFRCNLDGSELEAIFTGTASGNAGLALDEANGKIYFAQASTIYETDLDGTNERAINTTIHSPRDFEFYDGQLYYHRVNVIERLDLTNETRQVLFSDGNSIVGLALDPIRERVFWSDQSDGTVMSMALDGSDQQTHFSDVRGARGVVPDPNSSLIYFTVNGNLFAGNFDGTGLVDIADPILFGGFGLEIIPAVSPSTYTLGLNSSGSGSVSANPNQTTFEPDSVVSLTAAPDGGHQFIGWSGDASGNANPLLVTMDGDKTITANFQVIPNAAPVAHAGPNQVVVDSDGNGSEAVTLDGSASSDSDGQIDRWDWTWSGGSATGPNPTLEFPVGTTDVALTVTDNGGLTSSDSMSVTVEPAPLFFSVHFMLGTQGSRTGGGALTQVVQEGSTAVAPTFDVSAAWVFTGWDVSFENITGDLTVTAQYEAVTYSVIFDLGSFGTRSGGGALEQQVQHGEFAQAPTVLAQSGYAFTGWDSEFGPILSERTIRAEYVSGYVLSVAGGSGAGRYDEGEVISVVAENPDSGFRFSHWSADPVEYADNFAEADSTSTTFTMPAAAVSLTANYVEIPTYTITTSAGPNGSIAPENPTVIQGANQAFTITPDVGYYIASLSVDGVSVPVATSLTLEDVQSAQMIEATFARSSYTVTFDINGGTYSGGGNLVQTVPHGGTASQPLVLAPAGFDFERWDQALGPITSARTITAIYSQRSSEWHTVVFDVGVQGNRTGGGELRQDVRHGGSAVAPTLEVNTGWSFVGWSASFTAVLDNLQLEAIYTRDPAYAQLTVVSDYGVPSITGTRMVPLGDSITVTMEEMSLESGTERHNSTGWSASNGTSGRGFTASLTLSEDITLTWNWESEFYLDVATNGAGAVNLAPGFHAADSVVNLTATPDTGSEFQGWSGAASGMEPSISLSMDEAKSVTASFGAHLVEASIDTLNPVRTVLDAPITFGGSAAASGGATIEQYRWRMIELVDNVETGAFIDLSDQATFIRSNLPAGHWRVYFDALDSTGAWANAATEELRIENPALLTDLALTRADLRFIGADGTALDPMIANQVRFGDALRVQISVHNLGGVDIDTPVAVSLYDGSGPADLGAYTNPDGLLGVAEIETIPAGGLATATVEWQVGYDINGNVLPEYDGSFRLLTAVAEHAANQVEAVDGDNEALPIYEASPDNNRAQSTLLVGAVPLEDYQMAATLDDVTVREDQRAVLSGTARYLWLDNEDEVVGGLVQIVLDGRTYYGTTNSRGNFSVNADFLAPGSYSLTAEVSDGTLVASDTATLIVDPLAVPPAPRADLRVLEVLVAGGPGSYETESTMPHVLLNGAVNFAAEITNRGNLSVSAPFDVSFTVDGTDEVIGTVTVSDPLEVGASTTVYSPEPLWSSDTVGNYTIRATVDSGETVTEWSESNNSRTKVIAVHEARPDLRPYFISGVVVPTLSVSPAEPVQGETLTIGVDVYNAGPVDLPETSFVVRFLINGEVIGEEEVTAAINSEGHVHVEVPWDTSNEQAGFKDLAVIVDPEDVVLEDFENNNTAEATFELSLAQARLVIAQTPAETYWYSQTAYVETGKTLDLDVVVKNIGGVAYEAGSFLRMSEDQLSNEVSEPIPQAIPGMGVDRSRSLRMTWTAPNEPTSLTVLLHVDGSVVSKPVVVYPPASPPEPPAPFADPAIRNTDISILGSDWTRGDQVRAGATIRNLGELDAENVLVQFFYSVDSVGYTPLGLSQTIAALPAGTSVDLESTGTLEAVEPYYNIRVRITSLEADNRSFNDAATRSFAIEAPWADAGDDQVSVIGRSVMLDGSASQFETSYTWSFSSKPAGSEAQLAGANTVSPSFIPDFPGSYEIQLQVSDGALDSPFDWVNVLVNDEVATVLTVSSSYGTPSPAVGTHPVTIGSQLSISAADVVTSGVKRVSTGWSGTGIDPASGTTTPATITIIDELPSLTWEWETNYLLAVSTVGEGSITGDSGWLLEGGEVSLEAVSNTGYEFFKWTGDLEGSSENGASIDMPVDQARSVEAHFRPVPVANFTALVTNLETVQLSWTYIGLPDVQFRIERMLGGEGHWETVATVASAAYADNTVAEGQNMFYRVFAVHGGLDSASADTQIEVPYLPDVPAALGAESISSAEVLVIWQPAARADGYVVQRRHLPLGEWETLTTLGAVSTWSDQSVAAGERYAYRVRAYNASGNSGFSRTADAVLPPDTGDWTFGLQVDNVVASSNMLSGAEVSAVMDVLLSNPSGDLTQHRVVAGLRDAEGVAVGTPLELAELSGVPSYPPEWRTEISLPDGLRLPSEAGVYTLWVESVLGGEDPREAFAATMRTNETGMAKRIAEFTAVLPESGDAFVALAEFSGLAGEFIDLPITVGAISGENAFSFSLLYDPSALEFEGLTPLGAMEGSYLQVNDRTPGAVGAIMLLPLGIGLEAGVQNLATARFRIREGADGPVAVSFGDSPSFRLVSDAFANLLPHVWYDGQVSVSNVSYEADVSPRGNPNGEVNASDRIQIMRFVVGLEEPSHGSEFQRADCAPIATLGDGQINLLDAVIATRYAGGTEPLKKAGGPTEPQQVFSQLSTMRSLESNSKKSSPNGDAAVIRLQADTAERGELLEVPVSIQSGGNVEAASFSLSFDPNELVFLDAEPAAILSGALTALNRETATNGSLSYVFRLLKGNSLSSGEVPVLTLRFRVSEAASDATTTIAITSDPAPLMLSDGNGSEIPVTAQNTNVYLQTIDADGAPASVNDLTASLEGDQRVRLTWTDVPTESGYAVYRRSSLEEWNLLAELAEDTVSYLDEGLAQGVAYSYRIGAVNIDGESSSDIALVDIPSPYRQWVNNRIAQDAEGLPEADEDNDGLWNYLEFLTGRNPTQPDGNIFQIGREDIYGLGEDYLTLSFEALSDVSMDSILVETSHDLTSGSWQPATKVEDVETDNVRRLKYRSSSSMADEPRQFMRLRSQQ